MDHAVTILKALADGKTVQTVTPCDDTIWYDACMEEALNYLAKGWSNMMRVKPVTVVSKINGITFDACGDFGIGGGTEIDFYVGSSGHIAARRIFKNNMQAHVALTAILTALDDKHIV